MNPMDLGNFIILIQSKNLTPIAEIMIQLKGLPSRENR
jgi:hypothetical protein